MTGRKFGCSTPTPVLARTRGRGSATPPSLAISQRQPQTGRQRLCPRGCPHIDHSRSAGDRRTANGAVGAKGVAAAANTLGAWSCGGIGPAPCRRGRRAGRSRRSVLIGASQVAGVASPGGVKDKGRRLPARWPGRTALPAPVDLIARPPRAAHPCPPTTITPGPSRKFAPHKTDRYGPHRSIENRCVSRMLSQVSEQVITVNPGGAPASTARAGSSS